MKNSTYNNAKDLIKALEKDYNYEELYRFRNKYMEIYNENNVEKLIKFINSKI